MKNTVPFFKSANFFGLFAAWAPSVGKIFLIRIGACSSERPNFFGRRDRGGKTVSLTNTHHLSTNQGAAPNSSVIQTFVKHTGPQTENF